jgi:hypothetical protein
MLTGLHRLVTWLIVEICSITHVWAEDGRSMSFFNQIECDLT